jgi:hypothetical protein
MTNEKRIALSELLSIRDLIEKRVTIAGGKALRDRYDTAESQYREIIGLIDARITKLLRYEPWSLNDSRLEKLLGPRYSELI